jgi:glutathione S-transferase
VPAMMKFLDGTRIKHPPFAPPFLKAGKVVIGQTVNILLFLGMREGLAPRQDANRLWVHRLQLTIADLVVEVHDTHHPISANLYYEDQRREAKQRAIATARGWHWRRRSATRIAVSLANKF